MQYLKVLHASGVDPDELCRRYAAGPASMLPRPRTAASKERR